jgi:hypothetical protein
MSPNEDSRPTHPTSSIYTMDEGPLSRGVARRAGVCLPQQQNDISKQSYPYPGPDKP